MEGLGAPARDTSALPPLPPWARGAGAGGEPGGRPSAENAGVLPSDFQTRVVRQLPVVYKLSCLVRFITEA